MSVISIDHPQHSRNIPNSLHVTNVSACVRAPQGPPTLAVDVISSTCVDHEKIEMHLLKSLVVWPRPYLHVARPDATVIIPFRARSWNQGGLAASDINWGQYLLKSNYVFISSSPLQHDVLRCKMFISMFKCMSDAASPPWFQDLALNGIVTVASGRAPWRYGRGQTTRLLKRCISIFSCSTRVQLMLNNDVNSRSGQALGCSHTCSSIRYM